MAIAARRQRKWKLRGLAAATGTDEEAKGKDSGGNRGSQEDRMNELAAEKRRRRLKEVRNKVTLACTEASAKITTKYHSSPIQCAPTGAGSPF